MISFDNLFKLKAAELCLDKPEGREVTLVSHAHTDHMPTRFKNNALCCSKLTKKVIALRRKVSEIIDYKSSAIRQLPAGHILGSSMFLINKKLLYTGDFNTQGVYCGVAKPIKCETLIMECTYGSPEYIFPKKQEVAAEIAEYVQKHEESVIMMLDSFGKPQEICHILERHKVPFTMHSRIANFNKQLDLNFKYYEPKSSVFISGMHDAAFLPPSYKRVLLTGWIAQNSRFKQGIDKGFVFSSHSDYPSLIDFVRKCNPDRVYTHHGPAHKFAVDLRKLGYNAESLDVLMGKQTSSGWQRTLGGF